MDFALLSFFGLFLEQFHKVGILPPADDPLDPHFVGDQGGGQLVNFWVWAEVES